MRHDVSRIWMVVAAVNGFVAVAAGAFGAHGLRDRLSAERLAIFETGARYQMYHALALVAVAWAAQHWPGTAANAAGWSFAIGIVFFSGSLYALALSGVRVLGIITPFGGAAMLIGWACLAWAALRGR